MTTQSYDYVLAVDPSLTCTGWARFNFGRLVACGVNRTASDARFDVRIARAADVPRDTVWSLFVIEWPQVYTYGKSKGDPNDLLAVAAVAGAALARTTAHEVRTPRPAQWKGQVPKPIHNARVLARLDAVEQAMLARAGVPASLLNNVIDAIGLGLWALGRMGSNARTEITDIERAANDFAGADLFTGADAGAANDDREPAPRRRSYGRGRRRRA